MRINSPWKLKDIAALINATYVGDSDHVISGINEIHKVEKGDISFVDHSKYYETSLKSAASTVIINKQVQCPEGKALIFSDDPFRDYNKLVKYFAPFVNTVEQVSSTALIGNGTVIRPGVFIGPYVKIGKNCVIHANTSIYEYTEIGNNVIIHSNTVIGADAFYYKRRPEGYDKMFSCGKVVICDDVEIGASVTIDRGVSGDTVIGAGSKLDNQVQVGHDTVVGQNCLFAAQVGISGAVVIEDNVILWGQVGVPSKLTIGSGAVVLGQSGLTKSLEGNKTYFGSPAEEAKKKMRELALIRKLPQIIEKLG